jgi:hypothetical protein
MIFRYGAVLILAGAFACMSRESTVTGTVRDGFTGDPIHRARVSTGVDSNSLATHPDTSWTDSLGHFTLPRLQGGNQVIRARFIGYIAADSVLTVAPGSAQLDITLQRSTPAEYHDFVRPATSPP